MYSDHIQWYATHDNKYTIKHKIQIKLHIKVNILYLLKAIIIISILKTLQKLVSL